MHDTLERRRLIMTLVRDDGRLFTLAAAVVEAVSKMAAGQSAKLVN